MESNIFASISAMDVLGRSREMSAECFAADGVVVPDQSCKHNIGVPNDSSISNMNSWSIQA